jgi:hypothetical protein
MLAESYTVHDMLVRRISRVKTCSNSMSCSANAVVLAGGTVHALKLLLWLCDWCPVLFRAGPCTHGPGYLGGSSSVTGFDTRKETLHQPQQQ